MVDDLLARTWEQLAGRVGGPFTFRFVLQPTVAVLLAVRAEWTHARAWKDLPRLCVVAVVLDTIYQLLMLDRLHPLQAVLVVGGLAVVPYAIARAVARAIMH